MLSLGFSVVPNPNPNPPVRQVSLEQRARGIRVLRQGVRVRVASLLALYFALEELLRDPEHLEHPEEEQIRYPRDVVEHELSHVVSLWREREILREFTRCIECLMAAASSAVFNHRV